MTEHTNIDVKFSVWTYIFISFEYIPQITNVGPYGNSMFNHLRNCPSFPKQLHFTFPIAI